MRSRSRLLGFTLLEMLVTLVVIGMVVGILWQALFQIAQIEKRLGGDQLRQATTLLRVEWVRTALAGLLPGEKSNFREGFSGSASELTGLSTAVPRFPGTHLEILHLTLRFNTSNGETELQLHESTGDPLERESVHPLLSWPGQSGGFRYQDARGQWHGAWPPQQPDALALPNLILLETGLESPRIIVVAPQGSVLDLPSRKVLEQM